MNTVPEKLVEGSAVWQQVFLAGAALFILLQMISGWKLGPMRMIANICALVAAYAAAYFGGPLTVAFTRQFLTYPDIILTVLGGAVIGLLTYLICSFLGSVLFRKTKDQESAWIRTVYGIAGAFLGILNGCFFLWLIVLGVKLIGTIGETQIAAQRQAQKELGTANAPPAEGSNMGKFAARLKNSIELGVGEVVVEKVDVIPDTVYRVLEKLTKVAASPVSVSRFMQYPGAAELGNHAKIQELKSDPEIQKLVQEGKYLEMMRNQKIIDAANDPALAEKLKKFELEKAMDFALQRTSVSLTPAAPLRHTPLR